MATVKEHYLWHTIDSIRKRCQQPNDKQFPDYGGRGIEIFPAWRKDSRAFFEWIEENLGPRPEGMTLDRIDNDGNYEPGNLRWATQSEQNRNQRPRTLKEYPTKYVQPRVNGRWRGYFRVKGKSFYTPTVETVEEAHAAAKAKREAILGIMKSPAAVK